MNQHLLDDRIPYTYLIGWSKLNIWYYGVRFAKNCHPADLFTKYFTSSKHVKNFTKVNGNPDIIQIRKIFDNIDKARLYEHKVLRRMNVVNRTDFLNKSDGLSIPSQLGRKASEETKEKMRNRVISEATRKKISLLRTGKKRKPISDETRIKMSLSRKGKKHGPMSDETKHKLSLSHMGKIPSEETKNKFKNRRYISDNAYEKLTNINFFKDCIANGISSCKIANELGINDTTVREYAKKLNIKFPINPKISKLTV